MKLSLGCSCFQLETYARLMNNSKLIENLGNLAVKQSTKRVTRLPENQRIQL